MSDEYEDQQLQKQMIRQSMEWKETGELIEIWLERNTEDWTEDAFQIVGEILRERGVDLNSLGQGQGQERAQSDSDDWETGDEEVDEANRRFNQKVELRSLGEHYVDELEAKTTKELAWLFRKELVRLQAMRQVLADRGIDTENYQENDLNLPAETLKCAHCDADLPGDARYCPQCGVALYPEEDGEEAEE